MINKNNAIDANYRAAWLVGDEAGMAAANYIAYAMDLHYTYAVNANTPAALGARQLANAQKYARERFDLVVAAAGSRDAAWALVRKMYRRVLRVAL